MWTDKTYFCPLRQIIMIQGEKYLLNQHRRQIISVIWKNKQDDKIKTQFK